MKQGGATALQRELCFGLTSLEFGQTAFISMALFFPQVVFSTLWAMKTVYILYGNVKISIRINYIYGQ